jgi:hypothetical protein
VETTLVHHAWTYQRLNRLSVLHEMRYSSLFYKTLSGSYELRESRFNDGHIQGSKIIYTRILGKILYRWSEGNIYEIRKSQCSEGHSLRKKHTRTFARIRYIFRAVWINFVAEVSPNNLISDRELHQNRPNESQSLVGWRLSGCLSNLLHFCPV